MIYIVYHTEKKLSFCVKYYVHLECELFPIEACKTPGGPISLKDLN